MFPKQGVEGSNPSGRTMNELNSNEIQELIDLLEQNFAIDDPVFLTQTPGYHAFGWVGAHALANNLRRLLDA